jgi:hypothetical protein
MYNVVSTFDCLVALRQTGQRSLPFAWYVPSESIQKLTTKHVSSIWVWSRWRQWVIGYAFVSPANSWACLVVCCTATLPQVGSQTSRVTAPSDTPKAVTSETQGTVVSKATSGAERRYQTQIDVEDGVQGDLASLVFSVGKWWNQN